MSRLVIVLLLAAGANCWAVIESYEFASEDLRQRFKVLSNELRCPKCQNQNIADSNAPIAKDLRQQLHQQLHAGRSDEEIIRYMVQRYGEFVRYRPGWGGPTVLLWLAPLIFLALALLVLWTSVRRGRAVTATSSTLSDDERQRLAALEREID